VHNKQENESVSAQCKEKFRRRRRKKRRRRGRRKRGRKKLLVWFLLTRKAGRCRWVDRSVGGRNGRARQPEGRRGV